jgi:hypothetical protein
MGKRCWLYNNTRQKVKMDIREFPFFVASGLTVCEPVYISKKPTVVFYVFDKTKNIEIAEKTENVDMIVGETNTPAPVYIILIKFDHNLIYDCWLNYYAPETKGKHIFEALSEQNCLYLYFYSEKGIYIQTNEIENRAKDYFKELKQRFEGNTSFLTMKKIAHTKQKVMREFKNKYEFWDELYDQYQTLKQS